MSHRLMEVRALMIAVKEATVDHQYSKADFHADPAYRRVLALEGVDRWRALECIAVDLESLAGRIKTSRKRLRMTPPETRWWNLQGEAPGWYLWVGLIPVLLKKSGNSHASDWALLLSRLAKFEHMLTFDHPYLGVLVDELERSLEKGMTSPELVAAARALARCVGSCPNAEEQRIARRIDGFFGAGPLSIVEPGEAWTDQAVADLDAGTPDDRNAWLAVLGHCEAASGASPKARWVERARELVAEIGPDALKEQLLIWFPLVDRPRTQPVAADWRWQHTNANHYISEPNQAVLKGLCWIAGTIRDADLARALSKLALSAYRKLPGIGPRAVSVGNAAVYALGQMPGMDAVGQLAMLRVKVKFGTAQKVIDKALAAAAAREGLPRDEIDELGVPAYGLTEVGRRFEPMGDCTAELVVSGVGDVELRFSRNAADGKPAKAMKSVPAAVKTGFAEELKELKAASKDIAAMIAAQRDRLDSLFLENKTWPYAVWRERYLDHPLVGVLARRLIWRFTPPAPAPAVSATWLDGALVGPDGKPAIESAASGLTVRLWHPIEAERDEVLAWRRFFEDRQIRQPFKQAHREVYLLTDAERNTEIYSNRFAAHILRQHQFHALAAARNWKNKLRLNVDAEYPPATRVLPAWGLRAEYWVEGAGEEQNDAGAWPYLTTDQVRFYRIGTAQAHAHAGGGGYGPAWNVATLATALRLEEIPPLVFTEVMRDVDLFVGVATVGNNPQWQDGGPTGAYQNYWWNYSFGDLTESGAGRKELLERLVPRLAIAPACRFEGKFLVVKGKRRTYKIHLGSGNILMEPNDQYLCIVPGGSGVAGGEVFLPFEGDRVLSIILSKAMMLAEDDKITDPSITRQIAAR